jgi:hypothetical protein
MQYFFSLYKHNTLYFFHADRYFPHLQKVVVQQQIFWWKISIEEY